MESAVTVFELSHSAVDDAVEGISYIQPVNGESLKKLIGGFETHPFGDEFEPFLIGEREARCASDRKSEVMIETCKRPIMFGVLATRQGEDPTSWNYQTKYIDDTVALGGRMFGQGTTRSINAIFSLKSYLPFDVLPAWKPVRSPSWYVHR